MSRDTTTSVHRYAVDERLVMPETRFEVIDGQVVYVSAAPAGPSLFNEGSGSPQPRLEPE